MKKILLPASICIILIVLISVLFKSVFLLPVMFKNNYNFDTETNKSIKALVLSAVKDRCSTLYEADSKRIYNTNYSNDIIQLHTDSHITKKLICSVDSSFMKSLTQINDDEYSLVVQVNYPEFAFYHFTVKRFGIRYLITSFQIDA